MHENTIRERDESERLVSAVASAVASATPIYIGGRGSKRQLGPEGEGALLSVADHVGVLEYRPEELVLTARAGTELTVIRKLLTDRGQMLPCDPPTFGGDGTLGGAVAVGLAGPGRPWHGSVRDVVLGVEMVNGLGERLNFGGQVVKNVAGYDVSRLMAGAFGTLGLMLSVSVKVLPAPVHSRTVVFEMRREAALARVIELARSSEPITATCHTDDWLYVRLSGPEDSVESAAARLGGERDKAADVMWHSLRDQALPFFLGRPLWRLILPPAAPYPELAGEWLTEWAGGQRWLVTDAPVQSVREAALALGGFATLFDASADALQPLDAHTQKYHQRLKTAFDPHGIFNRHRMWGQF
jgi:glycolate oxidase FAD binding subunit